MTALTKEANVFLLPSGHDSFKLHSTSHISILAEFVLPGMPNADHHVVPVLP